MEKTKITTKDHTIDYSNSEKFWASITNITLELGIQFLLSHHDDGVIWGVYEKDWLLSENLNTSPQFNLVTLMQCRFFGPQAELFIWRTSSGYASRLLVEGQGKELAFQDSLQILWGDQVSTVSNNFTLMIEGEQGLKHLLPLKNVKPRTAIKVRSYIDHDQNNTAYYCWHRLYDLASGIEAIDYRSEACNG